MPNLTIIIIIFSEKELEDINIKLDKIQKFLEKQNKYFYSINMEVTIFIHQYL